jgi:hypothetical protein
MRLEAAAYLRSGKSREDLEMSSIKECTVERRMKDIASTGEAAIYLEEAVGANVRMVPNLLDDDRPDSIIEWHWGAVDLINLRVMSSEGKCVPD